MSVGNLIWVLPAAHVSHVHLVAFVFVHAEDGFLDNVVVVRLGNFVFDFLELVCVPSLLVVDDAAVLADLVGVRDGFAHVAQIYVKVAGGPVDEGREVLRIDGVNVPVQSVHKSPLRASLRYYTISGRIFHQCGEKLEKHGFRACLSRLRFLPALSKKANRRAPQGGGTVSVSDRRRARSVRR